MDQPRNSTSQRALGGIGSSRIPDWQRSPEFQRALRARIFSTQQELLSTVFEPYFGESDWPTQAACKSVGELFWNEYDDEDNPRVEFDRNLRINRAKAICRNCPVLEDCRIWALTKVGSEDRYTILGGMTWSQRKVWLRQYRPREAVDEQIAEPPSPRAGDGGRS